LEDLDAELILPTRFKDRNLSVNLHLRSIDQRLGEGRQGVPKNHARDLSALIFKREILMPAGMQFVIRDFTLHPNRAKFSFERAANGAG
jgi:hypothetical protein